MATAELEIPLIVDDVLEEDEFFLCFFFTQTTPGVTPAPPPNLFAINIKGEIRYQISHQVCQFLVFSSNAQ